MNEIHVIEAIVKTEEPTMKDYVKELNRLEFGYIVEEFLQKLDIRKIVELIENSQMSEKRKKAFLRIIEERFLELNNEVKL